MIWGGGSLGNFIVSDLFFIVIVNKPKQTKNKKIKKS